MGSSRLPGKVLLDIAGKPMIQHVIERTLRAQTLDAVTIATSADPTDDPLAAFAATLGVPCTRGSLHDVLDRYYQSAQTHQAEVIVRITADCPAIDPELIDDVAQTLLGIRNGELGTSQALVPNYLIPNSQFDFSCNRLPPPFTRTYPIGLDVEACTFAALQRAWQESTATFHREHVMPFLYEGVEFTSKVEGQRSSDIRPFVSLRAGSSTFDVVSGTSPRGFRIAQLHHTPDYGSLRWTVDTPDDLAFIREVFARLGGDNRFHWTDLLALVRENPELAQVNAGVRHKSMWETDHRH
jgi:spore coat polysaccharide biosynthesis protein SpsF